MFSLTVLNLDVLSAMAWKRPTNDTMPNRCTLPEAPAAPAPRHSRHAPRHPNPMLPGRGL